MKNIFKTEVIFFILISISLSICARLNQLFLVALLGFIYSLIMPGWLLMRLLFRNSSYDFIFEVVLSVILSPIIVAIGCFVFMIFGGKLSRSSILVISEILNMALIALLLLFKGRINSIAPNNVNKTAYSFLASVVIVLGLFAFSSLYTPNQKESYTELFLSVEDAVFGETQMNAEILIVNHEKEKHLYSLFCYDYYGNSLMLFEGTISPGTKESVHLISNYSIQEPTSKLFIYLHLERSRKVYRSIEIPGSNCLEVILEAPI